ncbi:hypothetical protein N2603_39045 [Bradyrhizobium huanghuaihaiense]|uniref:hypothetical protein n=1 Tax=Bradyrhizobium huanghuaihaiense TaxID=990078 RepID=UPI0021A99A3E|nr:hypothetical protein [Bradyrhizobium sp. CB3035]UWU75883.1 hypothetical protein N2603_39045 [Bradyrhizobium sp. CB3035]
MNFNASVPAGPAFTTQTIRRSSEKPPRSATTSMIWSVVTSPDGTKITPPVVASTWSGRLGNRPAQIAPATAGMPIASVWR